MSITCSKDYQIEIESDVQYGSYYTFEETPTIDDYVNNSTMTYQALSSRQAGGKYGFCAGLRCASGAGDGVLDIINIAGPADLDGWTMAGWHKFGGVHATFGGLRGKVAHLAAPTTALNFRIQANVIGTKEVSFIIGPNASPTETISLGLFTELVWFFFCAWWDRATGKFHVQIDNGATFDSTVSNTTVETTRLFDADGASSGTDFYNLLDELIVIPRVLSASEKTFLYNSGAGQTWPAVETLF